MSTSDGPPATAPAVASPEDRARRKALFVVFLVMFIDLLGFGIVLPLLSPIADNYVENVLPGGKGNRAIGVILGLLMASFSAMQFLVAPIWGRLSDRVGRRPILLLGLGGSVAFYCLFGFAASLSPETSAGLALTLLFVARIGAGIAGATIGTAQAVIADSTSPEKRRHGMAIIGAAFGLGFTFGPLIALLALELFPDHIGATGYVAAGLSLIALVLGLRLLPETRRQGSGTPAARKWVDLVALRRALGSRAIGPVILVFFLATVGFASFEVTLALLNEDVLQLSKKTNLLVFSYVGFVLMLTQGFLYRRLARRFTEPTFIFFGLLLMGGGVLALGGISWAASDGEFSSSTILPLLFVALAVAVVGFAFLTPSAQALISRRTDADHQGEILGVSQSAGSLARIIGPIFGLTLFKLTDTHMLPYLFGAGLLLLMLPLLPQIRRGGGQPSDQPVSAGH